MKSTLNMVRQPDFLNVSPNEVGNSWTIRVTTGFQRQTLPHTVHFVNWTLFILYVHGKSSTCMMLQMSKCNYHLVDCETALCFCRSLNTDFDNVVLIYTVNWKTKTPKNTALTNFCRLR
jgi:hypothetical protein